MKIALPTHCLYNLPLGFPHSDNSLSSLVRAACCLKSVSAVFLVHIFSILHVAHATHQSPVLSRAVGKVNQSPWKVSPSEASVQVHI